VSGAGAQFDGSTTVAEALSRSGERGCASRGRCSGDGNRESEREARDAIESIDIEWTPLPAAIAMEGAIMDGAPQVFSEAPSNIAYDRTYRRQGRRPTPSSLEAAHVVSLQIVNQRVVANYMEPRSAIGEYESGVGALHA